MTNYILVKISLIFSVHTLIIVDRTNFPLGLGKYKIKAAKNYFKHAIEEYNNE